ncbi:hypothetical protein SAMN04489735_104212 [Aneurinibacillus thermoaerophilus]|uniref:Uncharacterized protein n=1 Tax=Aneurinibacillus thermoaerophilus TaxID=143495 RepID=A0A1G8ECB7_ANETH|nr:hypothetical protein SAMN04489735_104212 [Aneurinibacillus thermoaerophilus]
MKKFLVAIISLLVVISLFLFILLLIMISVVNGIQFRSA